MLVKERTSIYININSLNYKLDKEHEGISEVGTAYTAQVVTRDVVVHLHEGATAPAVDAPAHIIVSREPFTIKPDAGMGVYLWSVAGGPATVVLTEAP